MQNIAINIKILKEVIMPSCRNCGARLTKFDSDICPVCGTKKPLEGVSSETVEITSQVDLSGFNDGQKVVRRRKKMFLLGLLVGFTGALFFYIKKAVLGLIWLVANVAYIAGLLLILLFAAKAGLVISILVPVLTAYLVNSLVSLFYFFKQNLKDGEGEFVV